jgi:hypothetical protein
MDLLAAAKSATSGAADATLAATHIITHCFLLNISAQRATPAQTRKVP